MIFLLLSGKMIFLFPDKMILFFRQKMKDDLYQKIHGNMIFSSNVLKRWSFQKKSYWNMTFLVLSWKMVCFFYPNIWYFFFWPKMIDDLYQEIHWNTIFTVYRYNCYKYDITLLPKKSKTIFFQENTHKGDWHLRLTF